MHIWKTTTTTKNSLGWCLCLNHLACTALWRGHTKGHRMSVYIRTHFCAAARLSISRDLCWSCEEHVPENKRLHLASQDRAQHVCLHVNESANVPRGEQRPTLFSKRARWTSWLSRRDKTWLYHSPSWSEHWRTNTLNRSLLCFKWSAVIHNSNKRSWLSPDLA